MFFFIQTILYFRRKNILVLLRTSCAGGMIAPFLPGALHLAIAEHPFGANQFEAALKQMNIVDSDDKKICWMVFQSGAPKGHNH